MNAFLEMLREKQERDKLLEVDSQIESDCFESLNRKNMGSEPLPFIEVVRIPENMSLALCQSDIYTSQTPEANQKRTLIGFDLKQTKHIQKPTNKLVVSMQQREVARKIRQEEYRLAREARNVLVENAKVVAEQKKRDDELTASKLVQTERLKIEQRVAQQILELEHQKHEMQRSIERSCTHYRTHLLKTFGVAPWILFVISSRVIETRALDTCRLRSMKVWFDRLRLKSIARQQKRFVKADVFNRVWLQKHTISILGKVIHLSKNWHTQH